MAITQYTVRKKIFFSFNEIKDREFYYETIGYPFDSWQTAYVAMIGIRKEHPEEDFLLYEERVFLLKGSSL